MTTNRNILERAKQSSTDLLREKMQMFLDNIDLNEETTDESTGLIFMIELAQRLEQARIALKDKQNLTSPIMLEPRDEFEKLKEVLDTSDWDAGREATYYAFFLHGWHGRTNNGVYQN